MEHISNRKYVQGSKVCTFFSLFPLRNINSHKALLSQIVMVLIYVAIVHI